VSGARFPASVALLVYFGVFWVLILLPFDFQPPRLSEPPAASPAPQEDDPEPRALLVSVLKTLGHSVLFLPLAPLHAWWAGGLARRILGPWAAVSAVLLAGTSELSQLTVSRGASWGDFAMDLLGYAAGAMLAISCERSARMRSAARSAASPRLVLAVLGALAAAAFVLLLPARGFLFGPRDLEGWDPSYPFLVGNEPTRSRPWRGAIERFAVYDRALEAGEIPGPPSPPPLLSYRFGAESAVLGAGGKVEEVKPEAGPILRASTGASILPLAGGGVAFEGAASFLAARDPPAVEAIKRSGELSVAARFRTDDIGQRGPARIVSSSINNARRNFTIGQDRGALELRIRTPLTGPNGSLQTLRADGCLSPGRWIDVLATYHEGELRIHVDGELRARLRLCLLGWLVSAAFGVGLTPPVASAIAFLGWAAAFALLWIALERLGGSRLRSLFRAALGGAVLVLAILLLAGSIA
jgi:hypothetical protein